VDELALFGFYVNVVKSLNQFKIKNFNNMKTTDYLAKNRDNIPYYNEVQKIIDDLL